MGTVAGQQRHLVLNKEHTLNIISISEASEFLLAGRVPHVVLDGSSVGMEDQRMDLHTQSSCREERIKKDPDE